MQPLNTRALAAEILGQVPGEALVVGEGGRRMVEGQTVERVLGVLAAQPPRLTGRNATKVIAAHLLGQSVSQGFLFERERERGSGERVIY